MLLNLDIQASRLNSDPTASQKKKYVCMQSCFRFFLGQKINETPKINTQYSQDAQDPSHPQYPQDTGYLQYPQEARGCRPLIPSLCTEGGKSCSQLWVPIIIKNDICVCCR